MNRNKFIKMKRVVSKKIAIIKSIILGSIFFAISPFWVGLLLVAPLTIAFIYYLSTLDVIYENITYSPYKFFHRVTLKNCRTFSLRKRIFGY